MRLPFGHRLALLAIAVVAPAVGCRHAPRSPARWADAHPAADIAIVVGEARSSRRGRPLETARVRLLEPNGVVRDSASTDAAGAFVLGPVPPGEYRLEVHAIVHRAFARSIALRAGTVDTVRLRLEYSDVGLIRDCVGPERSDGSRGFGSQFCRP